MKKRYKRGLITGAVILGLFLSLGYWYVFIAGAPQLDAPQAEANTGLNFTVETFTSTAMGEERRYGIVLPPNYAQKPAQHYPVIILLHGGHGGERDFQDKATLTSILHDLYKSRRLPPAIVITPDGNDSRGSNPLWDPAYTDGPNGKVATLLGSELVEVIKSRYRTLHQPQFWAMGGYSSGGWGAFNIGLRRLNQFHILFSHTGYFISNTGAANSPLMIVEDVPVAQRKMLRVYLDAGENDATFLNATRTFHERLSSLGIANDFEVYPGGHGILGKDVGWNYERKHLPNSLSYVGKQFAIALKQASHKAHPQPKKTAKPETTH